MKSNSNKIIIKVLPGTLFLLLLVNYCLKAQLSGNLSGLITAGTYIVNDDITVASTDILVISPGTKFLFKDNKQFSVDGLLIASGTSIDSIIFTWFDINKSWNGIKFNTGSSAYSILEYCVVEHSHNHGIVIDGCNPTLNNLRITNNSVTSNNFQIGGAGIFVKNSNSIMNNLFISNNSKLGGEGMGGGIFLSQGKPKLCNSTVINNSCNYYGGGIAIEGHAIVSNTIVSNNQAKHFGAGVFVASFSNPLLTNLTIANNTLSETVFHRGGGVYFYAYTGGILANSIIVNNNNYGICLEYSSTAEILNCDFYDNGEGNFNVNDVNLGLNVSTNANGDSCDIYNNIQFDPYIISIYDGEFHIQIGSPCIDAGKNIYVYNSTDLDGLARIMDGDYNGTAIVDMGAYEIPGDTITHFGGTVTAGIDTVSNGFAYLIHIDSFNNYSIVDTSKINSKGLYIFHQVALGNYIIKVILKSNSPHYSNFSPTYYGDQIFWQNASIISSYAKNYNIKLEQCQANSSGTGSIRGKIKKISGDPDPSGIQLMLLDLNKKPIIYTFSDNQGEFSLENLGYKTYLIHLEIVGETTYPFPITIDNQNKTIEGMIIELGSQTGVVLKMDEAFIIGSWFPNPVISNTELDIKVNGNIEASIYLYDYLGNLLEVSDEIVTKEDKLLINLCDHKQGIYIVKVYIEGKLTVFEKLIKINY